MGKRTLGGPFSALHSPARGKGHTEKLIRSGNPGLNVTSLLFQWFSTVTARENTEATVKTILPGLHRSSIKSESLRGRGRHQYFKNSSLMIPLYSSVPVLPKCGPCSRSIGSTWELGRDKNPRALLQSH